jgi:hypothetical protein
MDQSLTPDVVVNKGYAEILSLPSYSIWQHPTTFHVVIFYNNHMSRKHPTEVMGEFQDFGLLSDADVTIPVGMWREWVKESSKKVRLAPREREVPRVDWNPLLGGQAAPPPTAAPHPITITREIITG